MQFQRNIVGSIQRHVNLDTKVKRLDYFNFNLKLMRQLYIVLPYLPTSRGYTSRPKEHYRRMRAKTKRNIYNSHNVNQHDPTHATATKRYSLDANLQIRKVLSAPELKSPRQQFKERLVETCSANSGEEFLFGLHPILSALLTERRQFRNLFIRTSLFKLVSDDQQNAFSAVKHVWELANHKKIPILPVNKNKLDKLAMYGIHQGLCASVTRYKPNVLNYRDEIKEDSQSTMWILVDDVKDPMNMGAIIRSAVYFGVENIVLTPNCSKLSPVVSKASSGAMEVSEVKTCNDIEGFLSHLVHHKWNVIGTVCHMNNQNRQSCEDLNSLELPNRNTLLILGNEGSGMDENIKELCTHLVTIPSYTDRPVLVDSLNVSVACGILIHYFSRLLKK